MSLTNTIADKIYESDFLRPHLDIHETLHIHVCVSITYFMN